MADWAEQVRQMVGAEPVAPPPDIDADNRRETGGEPPDNECAARDAGGRFSPGASGNPATQFEPGRSGNPAGRPKGSFRAGARAAKALLDGHAPGLAQKGLDLAHGGDAATVRFLLARLIGTRRGQPVEFALPPIAQRGDLRGAIGAIAAAVGEGSLTAEEAYTLSRMLEGTAYLLPRS